MVKRAGRGLVEVLVVVTVVLVLTLMWAKGGIGTSDGGSDRPDGEGKTLVGRSLLAGKDTKCRSNIRQMRMSIEISRDPTTDRAVGTLAAIGLGEEFYTCAVGGETYEYDGATGDISCPHPGHDKY